MENKSDEQFLFIQSTIEAKRQETVDKQMKTNEKQIKTDQKLTQITEDLNFFTETITSMMDQTNNQKLLPAQKDTPNPLEPTTVVLSNRRAPPLNGGHSTNIGGMWTLKHEIISSKFYELLIKT